MLRRFFKEKWQQVVAALGIVVGVLAAAIWAGGVIMTATVVTLALYLGTMITLSRIPEGTKPEWGKIKKTIMLPLIKARNFLFDNSLTLTFLMGAVTGSIIGFTTVTGVVAIALSALLGDVLVEAYLTILDYIKDLRGRYATNHDAGLLQTSN